MTQPKKTEPKKKATREQWRGTLDSEWGGKRGESETEFFAAKWSQYSGREMVIASSALLDLALGEVLADRLTGPKSLVEAFLGLDGRFEAAPCGSFAARIKLARVTGIINEDLYDLLNLVRDFRNKMAHRVRIDFLDPEIQRLLAALVCRYEPLRGPSPDDGFRAVLEEAKRSEMHGEAIYVVVADSLHRLLRSIADDKVKPIEPWFRVDRLADLWAQEKVAAEKQIEERVTALRTSLLRKQTE